MSNDRSGTYIAASSGMVTDLLEVRFLLEPPIAAMAATHADAKDIKKSPHFAMKLKDY